MSGGPLVSVVICTQNRAGLLGEALASLCLPMPQVPYEIIVVDNGSVDETEAVVREMGLPGLHYLHVATPGLSRARNTGWMAARGNLVAFLDDDATAFPGWIDAVAQGFASDSSAGAIGGPVRPLWQAPRPDWLEDEIAHALTVLDWGDTAYRLDTAQEWLVGANMAVRREVLAAAGGFNLRLGRQGGLLLSNEETYLLRQVERLGHGVLYWPDMQVHHPVPSVRLDPRWLVQRHFWQGVSDARMLAIDGEGDLETQAMQVARSLPSPTAADALRDEGARFTQTCRAALAAGLVTGLLAERAGKE